MSQDKDNKASCYYALILDIQFSDIATDSNSVDSNVYQSNIHQNNIHQNNLSQRLIPHFSARYFEENLLLDVNDSTQPLQVFGWQDWYSILATVQTPCELWRFLGYHLNQLKLKPLEYSATSDVSSFDSEQALLTRFMNSDALFTPAIEVDNALIKYGMQDKPNSAIVTMKLAQKNNNATAQMY